MVTDNNYLETKPVIASGWNANPKHLQGNIKISLDVVFWNGSVHVAQLEEKVVWTTIDDPHDKCVQQGSRMFGSLATACLAL